MPEPLSPAIRTDSSTRTGGGSTAPGFSTDQYLRFPPACPAANAEPVLEKRVADWKARLLSEFRDETRFVLDPLLQWRSIALFDGSAADFETAEGFEDDDERGNVNSRNRSVIARSHAASAPGSPNERRLHSVTCARQLATSRAGSAAA